MGFSPKDRNKGDYENQLARGFYVHHSGVGGQVGRLPIRAWSLTPTIHSQTY